MKILHTSDLHLGKKLRGYDLIEEQRIKLNQIIEYTKENSIDVIILAGDIFDTSLSTDDAIKLFNSFLSEAIAIPNLNIFVIAGNHDSRVRLGNKDVYRSLNPRVHFATTISDIECVTIEDVDFYPIPFLKLEDINLKYDAKYTSLDEAFKRVIDELKMDLTRKNVCIAHQAVNPSHGSYIASDSEVKQIGGEDIISSSIFKDFSYVALGHIHMPQRIEENIYYSGSIFKYHHNESSQERSFIVIDTDDFKINRIAYNMIHDVKIKKGYYDKLIKEKSDDYIYFELLDETQILHAADGLKLANPNFLGLEYISIKSDNEDPSLNIDFDDKSYLELFSDFFEAIKGHKMTEEQYELMKKYFEGRD